VNYLDRLSRFVRTTRFDDLPAPVLAAARDVLLDTVGAILAGSRLPENVALARLAAERSPAGTASLLGHTWRADPMWASLANATAGVSLEVDEGNRWGGGHPAIHVIPAALAVAEESGAGARRFIESVVAGYEVLSRIGGATQPRANVHSHGTWGAIGAAVAVAKLLELDDVRVREVINLAASMSPANSWTPCFEGATIRNLYPGRAGLQGILAVHLQRCGFTGMADGPADVYGTLVGERFDARSAAEGLGREYRIQRNYFKLHACCLFNHPALDAVAAIRDAAPFAAEDVARIVVTSIDFARRMTDPRPGNTLAAKFSIPYAVAAFIVLGHADLAAFAAGALDDQRIRDLAAKVEVATDPAMSMRRAGYPTARVSIALRDGRQLRHATTVVHGDAENPAPRAALVDKFLSLAAPVIGTAGAQAVVSTVDSLEDLKDMRELTALIVPAG